MIEKHSQYFYLINFKSKISTYATQYILLLYLTYKKKGIKKRYKNYKLYKKYTFGYYYFFISKVLYDQTDIYTGDSIFHIFFKINRYHKIIYISKIYHYICVVEL
jgi:hypothetical protein